jgi:hypothetical protein
MKAHFLFLLSFCFALLISSAGCDSPTAVKQEQEKDSADVEQKQESSEDPKAEAESKPAEDESKKEGPAGETPKPETTSESSNSSVEMGDVVAEVAKGAIKFTLPANWENVKPRSFVVEYEVKVPKSAGEAEDAKDGRLTIMGAGGSIEANLDRWYGQYAQPDGSESKDAAKISESEIAGCDVTWFDLSGTMLDKPGGPMAGGEMVERENYRTLAAIIQAGGDVGQYFVKVYGPEKTIADNEAAFKAFVESLKIDRDAGEL